MTAQAHRRQPVPDMQSGSSVCDVADPSVGPVVLPAGFERFDRRGFLNYQFNRAYGLGWRLRGYTLDRSIRWPDLLGVSFLGGIGFTVALLVGELSYGGGTSTDDKVKVAVLLGSGTAAVIGAAILAARNRRYRHAAFKPALHE
jgi:hypothetical protein